MVQRDRTYRQHHLHPEAEIIKVTDGEISVITSDREISAKSGEILFINGGVMHHVMPKADTSNCIIIQTRIGSNKKHSAGLLSLIDLQNSCGVLLMNPDLGIAPLIDEINRESKEKNTGYELFIESDIAKITAILLRNNILPNYSKIIDSSGFKKIMPAIDYIEEHYPQIITLQEVADTVNLDKYYFCKLFKSVCNTTLTDYINLVRLSAAESLLRDGNNVTTASYSAGFGCSQYFNRCFKSRYGCSPSEYKKAISKSGDKK